jgi:hypothetical protein
MVAPHRTLISMSPRSRRQVMKSWSGGTSTPLEMKKSPAFLQKPQSFTGELSLKIKVCFLSPQLYLMTIVFCPWSSLLRGVLCEGPIGQLSTLTSCTYFCHGHAISNIPPHAFPWSKCPGCFQAAGASGSPNFAEERGIFRLRARAHRHTREDSGKLSNVSSRPTLTTSARCAMMPDVQLRR